MNESNSDDKIQKSTNKKSIKIDKNYKENINNKNDLNSVTNIVVDKFKNNAPFKPQRSVFFDVTLIYFILMIAFVGIRILSSTNLFDFLSSQQSNIVFTLLIQIVIMFLLPLFLYKFLRKKSFKEVFKDFRFKKIGFKAVLLAIGIGVLVYILNIAISSFFALIISLLGYESISFGGTLGDYSVGAFIIALVTTALLPGFCEEIATRGMLLKGFENLGIKKMIFFSGLLFGLMHLNIEQFFYATIIGWFLAFLCVMTGNIIPGMIIHFMNNGLSTYVSYGSVNGWPLSDFITNLTSQTSSMDYLSALLIIFVALISASFLLLWFVYLLIHETAGNRLKKITTDLAKSMISETPSKPEMQTINYIDVNIPSNILGFSAKQIYFPKLKEKIFLYSTFFLGGVITLFSFIWGVL